MGLCGLTWVILLKVSWLMPNLEVYGERVPLVDLASLSIMLLPVFMEMPRISEWCLVHLWGRGVNPLILVSNDGLTCFWNQFAQSTRCGYEARLCICCMYFPPYTSFIFIQAIFGRKKCYMLASFFCTYWCMLIFASVIFFLVYLLKHLITGV